MTECKIKKMSTFNIVTFICICTVGSAVLMGAKTLREYAKNNVVLVNFAMFTIYAIMMCHSLCYAELKEIFPEEGIDNLYVEKIYNSMTGSIYSLILLLISNTGSNTIFIFNLKEVFGIPDKFDVLFYGALSILVSLLTLIPTSYKSKVSKYLGMLQQAVLLIIAFSLPLSLCLEHKNPLIKKDEKVVQTKITADAFFRSISEIYFSYYGFNEANGLLKEEVGKLYVPYLCSTTALYVLYMILNNFFMPFTGMIIHLLITVMYLDF